MKKRAIIDLSESELKRIIAEYFGVQDKNDISFGVVVGQMEQEIITCTIMKEIEFPEKITIGRPNWWPEGAREAPYVQPTQPIDIPNPTHPHDPFVPSVTWSDRTESTYTCAPTAYKDTKGENK